MDKDFSLQRTTKEIHYPKPALHKVLKGILDNDIRTSITKESKGENTSNRKRG